MNSQHIEREQPAPSPVQIQPESEPFAPQPQTLKARDVARKIRSFEHFIYVWGHKARYYLPPRNCFTWHFVAQVLAQEKRLLKLEDVGHQLEVPKSKGLLVSELWDRLKNVNGLHTYFPDILRSERVPRDYFFNVA